MSVVTTLSAPLPVLVPLENVNDESVTLVRWLVESGSPVAEGQPIAAARMNYRLGD